ncbi:cell cycle checkpoint protein RAD17 [Anguilla rostrata]|uniref:cell cycle checkpoint protein RAD17 n=1 Tax=Anguilla rostrata TaxID=7938 RepID=UPI0030D18DDA
MSKLSAGRKASCSKLSSWVEPSFGDLFSGPGLNSFRPKKGVSSGETESKSRKQVADKGGQRPSKRRAVPDPQGPLDSELSQGEQDEPWVDRHAPCSQADLAVHKKKIEEVENWLKAHLDIKPETKGGATLLLTGPSGCGKTATVRVLAQELGCRVQEWSNPLTTSEFKTEESFRDTFNPDSRFNGFLGVSQTAEFQEFLLRANKYGRLQMLGEGVTSGRKVVLVEDLPNQFYRQPACLHDILRRFVKMGRCPLIFIVSDCLSGSSSSRHLFPRDLQEELGVWNISFNPVAPTSMMKVLTRIVTQEAARSGGRVAVPDKAALDLLCTGSSGDIRSAINSLQFSCLTDCSLEARAWPGKKGKVLASLSRGVSRARSKSKSSKSSELQDRSQAIGGKDASLFLFRALGKILYCKRERCTSPEVPSLPAHLSEHQRDRLLVDPELVVEKSHMSGELFNLYLQQNYLEFFSDVEDVARASEYLSDSDFLTAEWSSRSTMQEYGSSVATRGMIHSNSARAHADSQASGGFRPLHKPHWLLVSKKYRENCQAAQCLFTSYCLTPLSLQTELLPYLAQLTNPMRNQAQIAFIQDVGCLPLRKYPGRLKLEALTDKDPGMLDEDSEEEEAGPVVPTPSDATGSTPPPEDSAQPCSQGPGGDLPASQPQPTTSQALLEDEEMVIDEYDSD